MIEYLEAKGYSHEKAEALFNAFKASNAKPYGSASGRRGYRRRGYRHYHRRGRGGKVKVPAAKASAFKAKTFKPKTATTSTSKRTSTAKATTSNGAKALAASLKALQDTEAKVKPPKSRG